MHDQPDAALDVKSVALIGARGHTGAELIRLLDQHPRLRLALASSRELGGEAVADHVPGSVSDLRFENVSADELSERIPEIDVVILALPNGASRPFVDAIDKSLPPHPAPSPSGLTLSVEDRGERVPMVMIDLSADHRFDDTGAWVYGLPEHIREAIRGARRISNPGCYATGMQIALRPVLDLLDGPSHVFGVSGYSGAGTAPSERNDPARLHNNLLPYSLIGHTHEREASRHLGAPVRFMPHVAPFFRGITLTVSMELNSKQSVASLRDRYERAYATEPLIEMGDAIPEVRDIANEHSVRLGGLAVDDSGRHAVIVATIDNLLKGAATQAIQNLNLACGYDEFAGIRVP
jgi:N-acetyl-gamma-glutamylphosphate reductase